MQGGIKIAEMLYKTNILALVGGGLKPAFPPNQLILWDDQQKKSIGCVDFQSNLIAVKIRRNLYPLLETESYLYNFNTLEKIDMTETYSNKSGICSISKNRSLLTVALPSKNVGEAILKLYGDSQKEYTFRAHKKAISALALSEDGRLLATASIKGTEIRVFDTSPPNSCIQSLRRGISQAKIQQLVFHPTSLFLACTSERSSVHIFELSDTIRYLEENHLIVENSS